MQTGEGANKNHRVSDTNAYRRKLKERLKKDGNETVTNCHALKVQAADGKMRLTDVADTEQLLRLIQSVPDRPLNYFFNYLKFNSNLFGIALLAVEAGVGYMNLNN